MLLEIPILMPELNKAKTQSLRLELLLINAGFKIICRALAKRL